MNKLRKSLQLRLTIICMAVLIVFLSALHATVFLTMRDNFEKSMMDHAQGMAVAAAHVIESDIESYIDFIETRDIDSDYYASMQKFFNELKEAGQAKYVYTVRLLEDKENVYEFILDAEPIGSEDWSAPGDENWGAAETALYEDDAIGSLSLVDYSEWGKLIVGYSSIKDRDNHIVSLIGVDLGGERLYRILRNIQIILLAVYAVILLLTFILIKGYSSVMIEPMLTDKLTGAYTKHHHEKLISESIKESIKQNRELSLMMLDLDHFKKINDTYGHPFGDVVLTRISQTIKKLLRSDDYFIRYGGEEFVVVVQSGNPEQAVEIAERIRKAISETIINNPEHKIDIHMTISIGISTYIGSLGVSDLISRADKALYEAKKERNKVVLGSF